MLRDPIYKKIGSLIRDRRKTLGLKQEVLAKALNISRGSLANVETGRQGILVHQLYRFAQELELSPFDLLPQPPAQPRTEVSELPLPDDLKAKQKLQIAEFFSQVDTTPTSDKQDTNGKTSRR